MKFEIKDVVTDLTWNQIWNEIGEKWCRIHGEAKKDIQV